MSTRIIGGYGKIRFETNGTAYVLPTPNAGGLTETNVIDAETHVLENKKTLIRRHNGIRKRWSIDYSNYLHGQHVMKIQSLIDAQMTGHAIWFYPREMDLWSVYDVYIDNAEILLRIMKGNERAIGMKNIKLEIVTRELLNNLNWRTLETILTSTPTISAESYAEFSD